MAVRGHGAQRLSSQSSQFCPRRHPSLPCRRRRSRRAGCSDDAATQRRRRDDATTMTRRRRCGGEAVRIPVRIGGYRRRQGGDDDVTTRGDDDAGEAVRIAMIPVRRIGVRIRGRQGGVGTTTRRRGRDEDGPCRSHGRPCSAGSSSPKRKRRGRRRDDVATTTRRSGGKHEGVLY